MTNIPPIPKKGLGALGWLGIGCGGLIVLLIIGGLLAYPAMKGAAGKFQAIAAEAQTNPTRATASTMIMTGQFEMVKEDDANKRYTIRQKGTNTLITIYWDAKKNAPVTIPGDFSAIPVPAEQKAVGEKEEKKEIK